MSIYLSPAKNDIDRQNEELQQLGLLRYDISVKVSLAQYKSCFSSRRQKKLRRSAGFEDPRKHVDDTELVLAGRHEFDAARAMQTHRAAARTTDRFLRFQCPRSLAKPASDRSLWLLCSFASACVAPSLQFRNSMWAKNALVATDS
jgi:hypothetical protein